MPSEADTLKVVTLCDYLTEGGVKWRQTDYHAMKMVKALKGDEVKGTFEVSIKGQRRTFSQANIAEFLEVIPSAMARGISEHQKTPATLVPIPNSHVVSPETENFKTLRLAEAIAAQSGGLYTAVPALVFREPQIKARRGGMRNPIYLERAYQIVVNVSGPIVLIDDVCTLGGHLIAAAWKLKAPHRTVELGCTFGSTTKEQNEHPLGFKVQSLSLIRDLPDFF